MSLVSQHTKLMGRSQPATLHNTEHLNFQAAWIYIQTFTVSNWTPSATGCNCHWQAGGVTADKLSDTAQYAALVAAQGVRNQAFNDRTLQDRLVLLPFTCARHNWSILWLLLLLLASQLRNSRCLLLCSTALQSPAANQVQCCHGCSSAMSVCTTMQWAACHHWATTKCSGQMQ